MDRSLITEAANTQLDGFQFGGYQLPGQGPVADMVTNGFGGMPWQPGLNRPFLNRQGRPAVLLDTGKRVEKEITTNGQTKRVTLPVRKEFLVRDLQNRGINSPVFNATSLRKEEWLKFDEVILRAARWELSAWKDLINAASYGGFNAMGTLLLEHETMSDPGEAIVDLNGLTEGRGDSPTYQLEGLPLPITHSDFWFDSRRLAASRNKGMPLDVTMGEGAGRRIAESVEKTTIGIQTGITYGGNSTQVGGYGRTSAVYGYVNFPARIIKTSLYIPTGNGRSGTGWSPLDTVKDVLACMLTLKNHKYRGPFMVYHSNDWDPYLDGDYQVFQVGGGNYGGTMTLRDRLRKIDGIQDVKRLDFLFSSLTDPSAGGPGLENVAQAYPFTMVFVQLTSNVARGVNGMDITTIQWESVGGMRLNFKCMCIQVPQLRADRYQNTGILHATFNT